MDDQTRQLDMVAWIIKVLSLRDVRREAARAAQNSTTGSPNPGAVPDPSA